MESRLKNAFQQDIKADTERWKALELRFTQSQQHMKHGVRVSFVSLLPLTTVTDMEKDH